MIRNVFSVGILLFYLDCCFVWNEQRWRLEIGVFWKMDVFGDIFLIVLFSKYPVKSAL